MCGIIGYLGERSAAPIIMESLKRLEYRGYDSAGVAIFNEADGQTSVVKSAAKVDTLVERLTEEMPAGRLGIGHTRWATHGRPTVINAHPHTDCHKQIMVIHNGIIENFAELRKDLQAKGHVFISETDTEVVPHLIEEFDKGDLVAAVREALAKLRGAYAMVIFSQRDPELLIGARLNAPLVVGIGDKEWFVASDITAVIPYTKKVLLLGEGEMVSVTKLGPEVSTIGGTAVKPKVIEVKWDISQAQKGGFPHFMAKEINEAPEAVSNALRGRLSDEGEVTFEEFGLTDRQLLKAHDIKMVAAGTSYYAALLGKYIIEELARIPVEVEPASEFRYRQPIIDQDLHRASDLPLPARHPAGRGPPPARARAPARADRRSQGSPGCRPAGAGPCRGVPDARQKVLRLSQLHVHRPRDQLPDCPGRRAEAQGDLVPACRGVRRRRVEARADRPARQEFPRVRDRHPGRDPGEDGEQHPGGHRPGRAGAGANQRW